MEINNDETMPVVLGADNLVQMADMAEKRVQAIKRIKQAALSVTSKHDWVDQNGKPYLACSGSEKIARLFGISWTIDEPLLTTEESGHFSYTYKGAFTIGTTPPIEFIGSRGSKDPWFSKSHGNDIPPSEIDRNDIKKSAYTNLLGNGITRLLGLRNLTWEEVEAALGIKRDSMSKVEYGKKEMTDEGKDLRKKIGGMLLEMSGNDKAEAAKLLLVYTTFIDKQGKTIKGKSSLADVSEKAMPVTYGKVSKVYDEWVKEGKNVGSKDGSTDEYDEFEQSEFNK